MERMHMTKKGILISGHGSRDQGGIEAFEEMVSKIRHRHSAIVVEHGFLEFAHPTFDVAVDKMYRQGVRDIVALPAILFPGGHLKNDMPYEMNTLQSLYPDLRIRFGKHLGICPQLLLLSRRLIEEAEAQYEPVDRKDTCLLVVGRGTSDPDANSDVAKLARMLWEGMGFGFATTAFIGVTYPLLKESLPILEGLPFRRIITIPFFLFTGVLLKKIYRQIDDYRSGSRKEHIYTKSFESDELVLDALDERIVEVENGNPNMNCQLCKYRTQIVGYEKDVGQKQVGHHFHVRGSLDLGHAHDHIHNGEHGNILKQGHGHIHTHGGDHHSEY
jgi:sirohydrochlorin cobaltochelatase